MEQPFPRCQRCKRKDCETFYWFGDGPYHCQHLCMECFEAESPHGPKGQ